MIVTGNPVFNCSNSLLLFSLYKVTTGTYNLQSVITKAALVGLFIPITAGSASGSSLVALLVNTQFLLHLKSK